MFSRIRNKDKVVIGINLPKGNKKIDVSSIFNDGDQLQDFYSKTFVEVQNGTVILNNNAPIVLLQKE